MAYPAQIDADAAKSAIEQGAARLSRLVRSVQHPERPAIGDWTVGDAAVHVSHIFSVLTATAKGGGSVTDDIWDLGTMTKVMVAGESDRDLQTVAKRIDEGAAEFLTSIDRLDPAAPRQWIIGAIEVETRMLLGHVLNEILIHGRDIAKPEKLPWKIERRDAAMVVNGFLLPSLSSLGSAMMTDAAQDETAVLDIRVRGGNDAVFRFDKGSFSIDPGPASGKVDCHMSVDPEAFLLVAWNRVSQWSEIPKGKLVAWGRKPWVALKLRGMLRNP